MAVGKTSAARFIEQNVPDIFVSYENPNSVIKEIKRRKLNKDVLEDYIEIQKLFITNEIHQYQSWDKTQNVLVDFGVDEIEFHTLFYPVSMGYDWDIESLMKEELAQLRACHIDYIIVLQNSTENTINNKENDPSRTRNSFDFYQKKMFPLKEKWLLQKDNVVYVDCNGLSLEKQNEAIRDIIVSLLQNKDR